MIFKIGTEYLKIYRNIYNKHRFPHGQFVNMSEIKINDNWYRFPFSYIIKNNKYFIQIENPILIEKGTSKILEFYHEGLYEKIKISKIKIYLMLYILQRTKFNKISYNIKLHLYKNKNKYIIFFIALILSMSYCFMNEWYNNKLHDIVSNNNIIQSVLIFLALGSLINIFFPFTVIKTYNKNNISEIARITREKDILQEEKDKKTENQFEL